MEEDEGQGWGEVSVMSACAEWLTGHREGGEDERESVMSLQGGVKVASALRGLTWQARKEQRPY